MTYNIGLTAPDQLNVALCSGSVQSSGCIIGCHREVQSILVITVACMGIHSTGPNDRTVCLCFQMVAIHSLHQSLQCSSALFAVILSDNVGHGAVSNRQCAIVDTQGNILVQILGIDASDLYIIPAFLFHRSTLAEGKIIDVAGYIEIEPDSNLVPEHQRHTVQADACQVVLDGNGRNLSGNRCLVDGNTGIGQIFGIVVKVGLGCCTVVQHLLDHILNLGIIVAS